MFSKPIITTAIVLLLSVWSAFSQSDARLAAAVDCYSVSDENCDEVVKQSLATAKREMQDTIYLDWLKKQGKALADQGFLEGATIIGREAYRFTRKLKDSAEIGKATLRLGAYHLYSGNLDSSLFYHRVSLEVYTAMNDSIRMGFGLLNIGMSQKELGNYPEAFESYTKALELYKMLDNERYAARTYSELASLSAMTGEVDKAISYNKKAARFYENDRDQHTYAYVLTNLANDLTYVEREDTAEVLLKIAIPIFERGGDTYLLMNAEAQLGRVKYQQGKIDSAIALFENSNSRANEGGYLSQLAYNCEFLSMCYMEKGNFEKAIDYARRSYKYNQQIGYNEEYGHALFELYSVYKASGQPDSAIHYLELFYDVKDSLFGMEKERQLDELKVKYETELKEERLNAQEAEIGLLKAKSEGEKVRAFALTAGIILVLIIAILIIRNQRTRISHQKDIAAQQEQLHQSEIEKKEAINERLKLKLDHKKRELTSQALLIAEKNEMLRSFKEQLEDISEKAEENTAMNTLVKKIERAETKNEDWDKFMHIFEDVHPDFTKKLQQEFEKITTNDLRLAALMRMNFSNKEIANILHISADGLKKARYRLRKKLNLPSDENMQDFFLKV